MSQEIFISYSHANKSEAELIEQAFLDRGVKLIRDEREMEYRDDIPDFMRRVGNGAHVILLISDQYLKSRNCLFEVNELLKNEDFAERVYPIVLDNATDIYSAEKTIRYITYWEDKVKDLNEVLKKEVENLANTKRIQEEIDHYQNIRSFIDGFIHFIQNKLVPPFEKQKEVKFAPVIDLILEKKGEKSKKKWGLWIGLLLTMALVLFLIFKFFGGDGSSGGGGDDDNDTIVDIHDDLPVKPPIEEKVSFKIAGSTPQAIKDSLTIRLERDGYERKSKGADFVIEVESIPDSVNATLDSDSPFDTGLGDYTNLRYLSTFLQVKVQEDILTWDAIKTSETEVVDGINLAQEAFRDSVSSAFFRNFDFIYEELKDYMDH
ncbi:MAG: toll/interleukin-1 receptor domain-containing protein [Flavobacteriales bacterium]|nr:toll/interleukin-1 receptor domain-containing protein [Flavobacteriales bacterium]